MVYAEWNDPLTFSVYTSAMKLKVLVAPSLALLAVASSLHHAGARILPRFPAALMIPPPALRTPPPPPARVLLADEISAPAMEHRSGLYEAPGFNPERPDEIDLITPLKSEDRVLVLSPSGIGELHAGSLVPPLYDAKLVREAIARLVRDGAGKKLSENKTPFSCPIAQVYRVYAPGHWDRMRRVDQKALSSRGWSKDSVEGFIRWYDSSPAHRAVFLKAFSTGVIPATI